MEDKILTVPQAAKKLGVTRAAIYSAIGKGRLKHYKKDERFYIHLKDLVHYKEFRYSRDLSMKNGELLFDKSKGKHSVREAASIMKTSEQMIYYYLRMNYLKYKKVGSIYVLDLKDILEFDLEEVRNQRLKPNI